MTTFIFPGQGSQIQGMGKDLFHLFPDLIKQVDEILGYSIVDICLDNTNDCLSQTQYTQPALYVVNALYFMMEVNKGQKFRYLAGHSLGEYNALHASNVFDFISGLRLVQKRGQLMSKSKGGGMAAIIGLKSEKVKSILNEFSNNTVNISNYNSFTQLVISGPKNEVVRMKTIFEENGADLVIPLKVSGAFHSHYMQDAKNEFSKFLQDFTFKPPSVPVISNFTSLPYDQENYKNYLINQITAPVLWRQTIEFLLSIGEDNFIEIGPGKVLTGLVKRIRNNK